MSRVYLAAVLLVFLAQSLYSQNISSLYRLDTVIDIKIELDYSQFMPQQYVTTVFHDKMYIFLPSSDENDVFEILEIDLKTYKQKSLFFTIPSASFKTPSPIVNHMAINDKYLVLEFQNRAFAVLKRERDNFTYVSISPLTEKFEYLYLTDDDKVVFGHLYNAHPYDNPETSTLYVYSLKTEKLLQSAKPYFAGIAFSHFSPNHWIDVSGNKIFFAQTTNYDINILDQNLKSTSIIHSNEKWLMADTFLLNSFQPKDPEERKKVKDLLEKVTPIEDTVSRIEAIYAISDTELLVRKIPSYGKSKNRKRYIDIWTKRQNTWVVKYQNLTDTIPSMETVLKREDYPLLSQFDDISFFKDNYYIKIGATFAKHEYNLSWSQIKDNEDKLFGTVKPTYKIYVFKRKFK